MYQLYFLFFHPLFTAFSSLGHIHQYLSCLALLQAYLFTSSVLCSFPLFFFLSIYFSSISLPFSFTSFRALLFLYSHFTGISPAWCNIKLIFSFFQSHFSLDTFFVQRYIEYIFLFITSLNLILFPSSFIQILSIFLHVVKSSSFLLYPVPLFTLLLSGNQGDPHKLHRWSLTIPLFLHLAWYAESAEGPEGCHHASYSGSKCRLCSRVSATQCRRKLLNTVDTIPATYLLFLFGTQRRGLRTSSRRIVLTNANVRRRKRIATRWNTSVCDGWFQWETYGCSLNVLNSVSQVSILSFSV